MLVYNTLFSRILQEGNAYFLEKFYRGGTRCFPALVDRGIRTAAGGLGLTGRLLFLHRRTGVLELRQRVRPNGRLLFCTDPAGHSNCRRRVRPFRAGSFSLNLSGGFAAAAAGASRRPPRGTTPYPRRWAKRKDNLRFSFLFEHLPFPCLLARRRLPTCDRSEMGYGRGFFLPYLSLPVRSVRCHSATHVISSKQARHNSVAQFVSAL